MLTKIEKRKKIILKNIRNCVSFKNKIQLNPIKLHLTKLASRIYKTLLSGQSANIWLKNLPQIKFL